MKSKICIEDNPDKVLNGWIESLQDFEAILWLRNSGCGALYRYKFTSCQLNVADIEIILNAEQLDELLAPPIKPLKTSLHVLPEERNSFEAVRAIARILWSEIELIEINDVIDANRIISISKKIRL